MKPFFDRIFVFIETLAAGVWIGALVGFGFAVAGTVFQELPTTTLAGDVNAAVLAKLNRLEFIAAATMAASAIYFLLRSDWWTAVRLAKTVLVVVMVATLIYYALVVGDRLEYLRVVEIQDFDTFDMTKKDFWDEFARLHDRYTQLVKANLGMGVLYLLLSAFERRSKT
ncbi:MAG: DUF4149 domain-containing protein [Desulfurellaceae bacterium]|nr:DUF4149 domain-containing protein [Desulfurellaceae bacterium]